MSTVPVFTDIVQARKYADGLSSHSTFMTFIKADICGKTRIMIESCHTSPLVRINVQSGHDIQSLGLSTLMKLTSASNDPFTLEIGKTQVGVSEPVDGVHSIVYPHSLPIFLAHFQHVHIKSDTTNFVELEGEVFSAGFSAKEFPIVHANCGKHVFKFGGGVVSKCECATKRGDPMIGNFLKSMKYAAALDTRGIVPYTIKNNVFRSTRKSVIDSIRLAPEESNLVKVNGLLQTHTHVPRRHDVILNIWSDQAFVLRFQNQFDMHSELCNGTHVLKPCDGNGFPLVYFWYTDLCVISGVGANFDMAFEWYDKPREALIKHDNLVVMHKSRAWARDPGAGVMVTCDIPGLRPIMPRATKDARYTIIVGPGGCGKTILANHLGKYKNGSVHTIDNTNVAFFGANHMVWQRTNASVSCTFIIEDTANVCNLGHDLTSKWMNLLCCASQKKINIIYVTQDISSVPNTVRNSTSNYFLFPQGQSAQSLKEFHSAVFHHMPNMPKCRFTSYCKDIKGFTALGFSGPSPFTYKVKVLPESLISPQYAGFEAAVKTMSHTRVLDCAMENTVMYTEDKSVVKTREVGIQFHTIYELPARKPYFVNLRTSNGCGHFLNSVTCSTRFTLHIGQFELPGRLVSSGRYVLEPFNKTLPSMKIPHAELILEITSTDKDVVLMVVAELWPATQHAAFLAKKCEVYRHKYHKYTIENDELVRLE
jgi:hypothetical protein